MRVAGVSELLNQQHCSDGHQINFREESHERKDILDYRISSCGAPGSGLWHCCRTPDPVALDTVPDAPVVAPEHGHEPFADTPVEALLDLPSLPKPSIPPPITRNTPDVARIDLEVKEVEA